jgi:hypothetical protein
MGLGAGIGHNGGPTLDSGGSWRRIAWKKAREELLPTLPIEVVRLRVNRAKALGLPYKTYASFRATTGHDLLGFLFSSNALRLDRGAESAARLCRIEAITASRVAVVVPPLRPEAVARLAGIDAAHRAPSLSMTWRETREAIKAMARAQGHRSGQFVLIGETALEEDWAYTGQTAGFLAGERFFAAP